MSRFRLSLLCEETLPYAEAVSGTEPAELAAFFWSRLFHDEPREVVAAAFFDDRGRMTGYMAAFTGTLSRAGVDPRHILAAALLEGSRAIAIAHNHPSGEPDPSTEDLLFTRRLFEAAHAVGIELLDHVVVGSPSQWVSLRHKAIDRQP